MNKIPDQARPFNYLLYPPNHSPGFWDDSTNKSVASHEIIFFDDTQYVFLPDHHAGTQGWW
jgi:hypothetical protein